MWKGGFLNPQDILGFLGKSPDEHLDERIAYLTITTPDPPVPDV